MSLDMSGGDLLTTDERLARVTLAGLVEPGNRDVGLLVDECGPAAALTMVYRRQVDKRLRDAAEPRLSLGNPLRFAEAALERTERLGARIVTPADDEWPRQLDDLRRISREAEGRPERDLYPPLCLWLRGEPALADTVGRSVAIVGARASTPYGNHVAQELAYEVAGRSWCVVSGGAFGIDAQAHRGTLTAGGITVAVLACGIDRSYPTAHASLFERIADTGIVLSEWPPGAEPHRHRFLIRNRVIAALTRGTVVVEASARSGAKQTATRARQLGRSTMAVPGPITSAMSVGTHQLLRTVEGRLVTSAAEIIEEVGLIGDDLAPIVRGPDRDRDRLGEAVAQVLDGVPRRPAGPQEIAAAAGVSLRTALRALPDLVEEGFVIQDDSGYRVAPNGRRNRRPAGGNGSASRDD
jgi:DNA processing protein